MRAALIAATLAAIAAPAYAGLDTHALVRPGSAPFGPNVTDSCQALAQKTADRTGAQFKRLDQLPWGIVEHAVLRSVDGCPVREVVYQGRTYWVQPGSGPRFERVQPLTEPAAPTRR